MDRKLYWGAILAAMAGIAISIYMTIFKLTDNAAMCLGNGGCSVVNASSYSAINGIPLGVFGIIGFGAIVLTLFLENRHPLLRQYGNLLAMGMALAGTLYSAYLTYLEFYVIKAVCPFCVASATAISLAFIFTLIRFIRNEN